MSHSTPEQLLAAPLACHVQEKEDEYAPRSLFCLTLHNPLRKLAIQITAHRYYEWFTLVSGKRLRSSWVTG